MSDFCYTDQATRQHYVHNWLAQNGGPYVCTRCGATLDAGRELTQTDFEEARLRGLEARVAQLEERVNGHLRHHPNPFQTY